MIKRQKLIGIVASVLLAGIGTSLLVAYVRGAEHRAVKSEQSQAVLVVTGSIAKGTRAEDLAGRVKLEQVPSRLAADGAVTSLTAIAGRVSVVDLVPGDQVVQHRFLTAAESVKASAAPGMLQVTVAIDAVRALGGRVRAGDSVGVLATFDDPETTRLFLQKVAVTDVRNSAGAPVPVSIEGTAPTGTLLVTLAVDAPSVERLIFSAEQGRLWLAWEPKEAAETGTKVQTRAGVNL